MKAYTDLPQSKKLAEILPIESADMCFVNDGTSIKIDANPYNIRKLMWKDYVVEVIPCWSLAALLNVLPNSQGRYQKTLYWFDDDWHCEYVDENSEGKYGVIADNPIDACYEMIIKLHEQKLL